MIFGVDIGLGGLPVAGQDHIPTGFPEQESRQDFLLCRGVFGENNTGSGLDQLQGQPVVEGVLLARLCDSIE